MCNGCCVDFQKRLVVETLAGSGELIQRTVRKMLIIMPESCFCPPQFSEHGKIEHTDKYVVRVAHRAGNTNRDYKSSLYKIIDQQVHASFCFSLSLSPSFSLCIHAFVCVCLCVFIFQFLLLYRIFLNWPVYMITLGYAWYPGPVETFEKW